MGVKFVCLEDTATVLGIVIDVEVHRHAYVYYNRIRKYVAAKVTESHPNHRTDHIRSSMHPYIRYGNRYSIDLECEFTSRPLIWQFAKAEFS